MAGSRGTVDKNSWSPCSVDQLRKADTECLDDTPDSKMNQKYKVDMNSPPGLRIDAREQCSILLLDKFDGSN